MTARDSLWGRIRTASEAALKLASLRLDLIVTETELFVAAVISEWLLGTLGVLLLVLGLAALGVWVVLAAGEAWRLTALALVTVTYFFGALGCALLIRVRRAKRGAWLAVSRRELAEDCAALCERLDHE